MLKDNYSHVADLRRAQEEGLTGDEWKGITAPVEYTFADDVQKRVVWGFFVDLCSFWNQELVYGPGRKISDATFTWH